MRDEETGFVAPKAPKRTDIFLLFCRLLNMVTMICAMLCMVAHGMAFVVGPPVTESLTATLDQSLRMYGVGFSALVILVETDWQKFMVYVKLFDSWIVRGLFQVALLTPPSAETLCQTFLVVLTLSVAVSDGDDDFHMSLQLYRKISGLCLIGCAGVYIMGGLLCFSYIKRSRMRRMVEVGTLQSTLQTLERQEKEVRKALARYSSV